MKKTITIFIAFLGHIVSIAQTITTIAGVGVRGYSGDGGLATSAKLYSPGHLAFNNNGDIIFADYGNNAIRRINASGIITTIAGGITPGYSGDGGPASTAQLNGPNILVTDRYNNIFFADEGNSAIRKIDTLGIINTVAGTGVSGYNGDGISATTAELYQPDGVAVDSAGNLFIADTWNHRIRKVNTAGIISTVGGVGTPGFSGDGGPATNAQLHWPVNLTYFAGQIYIADQFNQRVRKIDTGGIMTTFAGNGSIGFSGDGGPAIAAELYYPSNITVYGSEETGGVYITDSYNNRIRLVNSHGIITTVVGNGVAGYSGDGGPAVSAELNQPWGATFDYCGNMYIGDAYNNVIRKVEYFASMPPIAGNSLLTIDSTVTLTNTLTGGVWSCSNPVVATVGSSSGLVSALSVGTDTITYTTLCGSSSLLISVGSSAEVSNTTITDDLTIFPNPTKGIFIIKGRFNSSSMTSGNVEITDITGRPVLSKPVALNNEFISVCISLDNDLADGIYILNIRTENMSKIAKISLYR